MHFVSLRASATKSLFSQSITIGTQPVVSGKIAFLSDRDGNWEIYVVNLDGSDVKNLSNHQAVDASPAWGRSTASF